MWVSWYLCGSYCVCFRLVVLCACVHECVYVRSGDVCVCVCAYVACVLCCCVCVFIMSVCLFVWRVY